MVCLCPAPLSCKLALAPNQQCSIITPPLLNRKAALLDRLEDETRKVERLSRATHEISGLQAALRYRSDIRLDSFLKMKTFKALLRIRMEITRFRFPPRFCLLLRVRILDKHKKFTTQNIPVYFFVLKNFKYGTGTYLT